MRLEIRGERFSFVGLNSLVPHSTLKVNYSKGNSQIGLKYKLESVINPVIKFRKLAFLPTFPVREQVVSWTNAL